MGAARSSYFAKHWAYTILPDSVSVLTPGKVQERPMWPFSGVRHRCRARSCELIPSGWSKNRQQIVCRVERLWIFNEDSAGLDGFAHLKPLGGRPPYEAALYRVAQQTGWWGINATRLFPSCIKIYLNTRK